MQIGQRSPGERRQRGAMAILTGLMAVVLLGIGGLVIDLGRLYIARTEVQTAMDACALAASSQLMPCDANNPACVGLASDPRLLSAAAAYGRAMVDATRFSAGGIARPDRSINRVLMQSRPIDPASVTIRFAANLNGPFESATIANSLRARFVRCSAPVNDVSMLLSPILNLITSANAVPASATVAAAAVAGREPSGTGNPTGPTTCQLFPLALCDNGQSAANHWGYEVGQWVWGPCDDPDHADDDPNRCIGSSGRGQSRWISLDGQGGDALRARIAGQGECGRANSARIVTNVTQALRDSWNTRFGIYAGLAQAPQSNPPDFSGHAYTRFTRRVDGAVVATGSYIESPPMQAPYANEANLPINAYRNDYLSLRRLTFSTLNQTTAAGFDPAGNFGGVTTPDPLPYRPYGQSRRAVAVPVIGCPSAGEGEHEDSSGTGSGEDRDRRAIVGFACVFLLRPMPTSGLYQSPTNRPIGDDQNISDSRELEYLGRLSDADTPCRLAGGAGYAGDAAGTGFNASAAAVVPRLMQ